MGSNGKKKTTMAKLNREHRLREKRYEKQLRKEARKQAAADEAAGIAPSAPLADDEPQAGAEGVEPAAVVIAGAEAPR
jgi:hypothetical protein